MKKFKCLMAVLLAAVLVSSTALSVSAEEAGNQFPSSAGENVEPENTEPENTEKENTEQENTQQENTQQEDKEQSGMGEEQTENETQKLENETQKAENEIAGEEQNQSGNNDSESPEDTPVLEEQSPDSSGVKKDSESIQPKDGLKAAEADTSIIAYHTHVQTYGWQDWVMDGAMSGTSGQAKRLEGIEIKLNKQKYPGGVRYRTHVQTYGWQDWSADGAMSGTSGQAKRLEAIQIELTGEMAEHYDIYYRVHAQTFGWMGWAKNGSYAGSAGYAKRLEGIEIKLVEKEGAAPGSMDNAYRHPFIQYQTHVQSYGWQNWMKDGAMSGTSGQAKRLEGIRIQLQNQEYEGSVQYRTHVQTYGWQDWAADGGMSGTTGQAKRLEAIQIQLTGEMAVQYDIYYRVHAQTFGWMSWVKNGEQAGTVGCAKRLEGIEIRVLPKGSEPPANTTPEQSAVAKTKTAQKTGQIVVVNAHGGTAANVQLWEKQGADWVKVKETNGYVGSQGVGAASEYVSKTPSGSYSLGFAFGTGSNPGTKLDYRQITKNSYWISNVEDPQYNTWQERSSSSSKDEHLIDYPTQYEFGITLNYNQGIGGGSAFFLHVSNGKPTAGCIAVPRGDMLYLMQHIRPGAYIINVNSENELAGY